MKIPALLPVVASAFLFSATGAIASPCPAGDTCIPAAQPATTPCPAGDTCTPSSAAPATTTSATKSSTGGGVVSDIKSVSSVAHTAESLGNTIQGVANAFNGL